MTSYEACKIIANIIISIRGQNFLIFNDINPIIDDRQL